MSARQQFLVDAMVRAKRPSISGLSYEGLGLTIGLIFVTITLQSKNVWLCGGKGTVEREHAIMTSLTSNVHRQSVVVILNWTLQDSTGSKVSTRTCQASH